MIAVIAVVPCTPQAANAFRSAWIPAPPPESEPAIESTAGRRTLAHRLEASASPTAASGRGAPAACASSAPARSAARSRAARAAPAHAVTSLGAAAPGRPRSSPQSASPSSTRSRTAASCGSSGGPPAAGRGAPGPEQRVEDVLGVADHARAVGEQLVGPDRHPGADRARHRADVAAQLLGHLGGDQRARAPRRLDHDRHRPERGHDPVAGRKRPAPGAGPGRQLREHQPALADPPVEARGGCRG